MTGKDILMALNDIEDKYIQEAEHGADPIQFKEKKSAPSRKLGKILLLAAALSLLLTGCAYAVLKVQDMMYEKVPVTVHFDNNGKAIEPTEKILERYTPFSFTDGPIAKATKEWNEFLDSYDMGEVDMEKASKTIPENYYHTYECFNQEMVDKLKAILAKNNLKPLDKWLSPIIQENFDMMYDAYGIDGLLRPGAQADIKPTQGQFNSCGDFEVLNHITLTGADAIYKEHWSCFFDYAKKDVFWERMGSSIEGEYQQWNYTTADGTEVLLILRDNGNADIHADVGDAVIYMTIFAGEIGGDRKIEIPPRISSKEELEQIADIFDYHMKPHPFDRAEVERQLNASINSLAQTEEPTQSDHAEVTEIFKAQDMMYEKVPVTVHFDHNGEAIEPTEKILERYTPFSLTNGPIAKAIKEWNDFLDGYNMGSVDMETASKTIPENYYHTYECFDQNMVDKLEEILSKNNLKPLDKWLSPIIQENFDMMFDAYGIDGLLRPGVQADIKPMEGQFNSCGDFEVVSNITLTGADAIYKEHWSCFFDYAKKDVFWERMGSTIEGEYQQWNYTTADGTKVLLILRDNGNADIHADVGDAVIYMTIFPGEICGDREIEIPPKISSREALEQIADIFDYHMNPHPFDRAEVERQLDASINSQAKP